MNVLDIAGLFLKGFDLEDLHGKLADYVLRELCHAANKLVGRDCPLCGG